MTAIEAMPHFQKTFGVGTTGPIISVIFSMYTVGSMLFAPVGAVLSDRYGRRVCMATGAATVILGMVVMAPSKHIAQVSLHQWPS